MAQSPRHASFVSPSLRHFDIPYTRAVEVRYDATRYPEWEQLWTLGEPSPLLSSGRQSPTVSAPQLSPLSFLQGPL